MGKNRKIKMMQLTISKKAVSPLIATVLLMAFAVALGAIVMTWGKEYVEATTEDVSASTLSMRTCSLDVSLDIMRIGSQTTLCYRNASGQKAVEFIINNRGSRIDDLQVSLIGKDNVVFTNSSLLKSPIEQAGVRKITVNYDVSQNLDPLQQIIITPKIKINGEPIYCTQRSLEYDIIDKCT